MYGSIAKSYLNTINTINAKKHMQRERDPSVLSIANFSKLDFQQLFPKVPNGGQQYP